MYIVSSIIRRNNCEIDPKLYNQFLKFKLNRLSTPYATPHHQAHSAAKCPSEPTTLQWHKQSPCPPAGHASGGRSGPKTAHRVEAGPIERLGELQIWACTCTSEVSTTAPFRRLFGLLRLAEADLPLDVHAARSFSASTSPSGPGPRLLI